MVNCSKEGEEKKKIKNALNKMLLYEKQADPIKRS